ncbi:hypothetical protein Tco_0841144 [Tanacetum coccineum]|uniref:Secreted protein n=1 Tax=Tanacetum coccineum TaxID=301880 RepID=A0ABQ5AY90_9ASTR
MSSLASFFLCSCLMAPRRENTLAKRDKACDEDLPRRSFLLLSSDHSRENTFLDRDEDGDLWNSFSFPPLFLGFFHSEAHVPRTQLCTGPTDDGT